MITLGIETTAGHISTALSINGQVHINTLEEKHRHSEMLAEVISQLLKDANVSIDDIDYFACTNGPGSFTGIRSGLSFMQGLSYAKGKKMIAVSSLEIMLQLNSNGYVVVAAGKGNYYVQKSAGGKIEGEIELVSGECVESLRKSKQIININEHSGEIIIPSADLLCRYIESKNFNINNKVAPLYVRKPQAEIDLQEKS